MLTLWLVFFILTKKFSSYSAIKFLDIFAHTVWVILDCCAYLYKILAHWGFQLKHDQCTALDIWGDHILILEVSAAGFVFKKCLQFILERSLNWEFFIFQISSFIVASMNPDKNMDVGNMKYFRNFVTVG